MEPCGDLRQQILQTTLQQISSQEASGATECCVICLANLAEPCEALPCRHNNFDYLCLVTWLERRPACPLCKSNISEVRYELGKDGKAKVYTVSEVLTGPALSERRRSSGSDLEERPRWLFNDEATQTRRRIYLRNLYSLHMGSNRRQAAGSRYRELLPEHFMAEPELVARARLWLSRELRVFEFLHTNGNLSQGDDSTHWPRSAKAGYLLEYIIAILKSIDTQSSTGQVEDMISEFLGCSNTRLFLHELRAWLRSPFQSLSKWDRAVQYPDRNASPQIIRDT
ncbi:hypothetical protein GGR58DRAFT_229478 [Xylaria digitata]|nr:hypothetical protein GGR58DRAFT_229478 [Xylaria digitata]